MSKLTEIDPYQQFLRHLFHSDDDDLARLQAEADAAGLPHISIGPEQGKFLQVLVQLTNARKVLEIGVLGGYSGAWIARALPPDGKLFGLEQEQKHADFAREQWRRMGLSDKIEVRVGAAMELLPGLADEAPFDLIFVDADKNNYPRLSGLFAAIQPPGDCHPGGQRLYVGKSDGSRPAGFGLGTGDAPLCTRTQPG